MYKMSAINEHITFNEMVDFYFADTLDDSFIEQAAKINAHLVECAGCMQDYEALQAIEESFNRCTDRAGDRAKAELLEGIYCAESEHNPDCVSVSNCVAYLKRLKFKILVTIDDIDTLVCQKLDEVGDLFRYPQFATAAKSISESDGKQNPVQAGEIKSMMLDSRKNRVSIGMDRTLSLYFKKDECPADTLVILIPDASGSQPHFAYTRLYDEANVVVRFEDVHPGSYKVTLSE